MADGAGSGAVSWCVAAGSSDAGNTRARAVCDSTDAHRAAVDRNTARNPSDPWRPRGLSERSLPTHHSCPVHEGTIVRGPPRSHCSTSLLNLKSSHITRYGTTSRRSAGRRVFFAMTSFNAAFSSDRSTYIRLRRSFSCSSFFSRLMSEAFTPPYVAFDW